MMMNLPLSLLRVHVVLSLLRARVHVDLSSPPALLALAIRVLAIRSLLDVPFLHGPVKGF